MSALDSYRHLWRPGQAPEAPTLVLFHGTGGSAADMLRLGQAVAPEAAMLALEGDVDERGQARFFRRRAEGDYDLDDLARRTAAVGRFLEAAFAEYGIDGETAVGLGYSNGANILANLSFAAPRLLRRIGLMHPLIPFVPQIAPAEGLTVTITAGQQDPICPPDLTRRLESAYRRAGADVATLWHPGGHEIRPGEIAAVRDLISPDPDQKMRSA